MTVDSNAVEVEPSRRERKAVERRLAILRAAAGVFRDRGYASASMDEIAERLDMAKGNLYYYFSNKHELLFFCQDYSLDTLIAGVDAIASRISTSWNGCGGRSSRTSSACSTKARWRFGPHRSPRAAR
ncbi:MAG: TetR/AcrR family transcriptional regulator [Blastocatellia bacterium]|nr:TetR/AcrR family transcriptional regulator [Blastocatellia bacterium]